MTLNLIQEIANLVNESAVANISNLLKDTKTLFVHFSTDYVFDGASGAGYKNDNPKPINTYGLSKLNGEKAIVQSCTNYLIFLEQAGSIVPWGVIFQKLFLKTINNIKR